MGCFDNDAVILLCKVENPERFGIADIDNDKIIKIIEKPKIPPTNFSVLIVAVGMWNFVEIGKAVNKTLVTHALTNKQTH